MWAGDCYLERPRAAWSVVYGLHQPNLSPSRSVRVLSSSAISLIISMNSSFQGAVGSNSGFLPSILYHRWRAGSSGVGCTILACPPISESKSP